MKNLTIRSYVMTIANQLKKNGQTFSQAMKTAWKVAKLKFQETANFEFVKQETGEIRKAIGQIVSYYISKQKELIVTFNDLEKNALRSFRAANLI